MMEQWEEARQWEKVLCMTNNNDNNASRPPTMTTMMMTITIMMTLHQSLPFFIGFFIVWLIFMG
jgi:hypothetical protein